LNKVNGVVYKDLDQLKYFEKFVNEKIKKQLKKVFESFIEISGGRRSTFSEGTDVK
jgi:hypothetical protein